MPGKPDLIVRELLDRYGCPYAVQAGIRLADRPGRLYQLLVLSTLLTARIPADVAITAALVRVSVSPRAASEVTAAVPD